MPKIFRGITPTPEGSAPSNSASNDSEPTVRKYSPKSQYKKYQTSQDPIHGLDKYKEGLDEFKAKHNKAMPQPEEKEKSIFKQGFAKHNQVIEDRALKAYKEVTGKSFAEVEANKDKILKELGIKGKSWYRKSRIEQEIAADKKRMPYMKSWERKNLSQVLEAKKKTFGLKSASKKSGWF